MNILYLVYIFLLESIKLNFCIYNSCFFLWKLGGKRDCLGYYKIGSWIDLLNSDIGKDFIVFFMVGKIES